MIIGSIPGQTAIKKPTGGYAINDNPTRDKYYGYTAPKKTTTKPKTVSKPKTVTVPNTTTFNTVSAPAPVASTLDDLVKKYLGQNTTDINSIYDQQQKSQLDQLKSQRDAAIGKINQQESQTNQDYYDKRNAADVVNMQNVQKLREIMGQNGLLSSGENLTATAQANADRQNSLNSLNLQEQAAMNDYKNQINDINDPSKDQAIINQIASDRAKALLDAKNQAFQKAWQDYVFNNLSADQQASLGMNKYQIDATNAANAASNQAALNYYSSAGFNGSSGGGGTAQYQKDMSKAVTSGGVPSSWVPAMSAIVAKESSYNSSAKNPSSSAYGYGQLLSSTQSAYAKGLNYNNGADQLIAMARYIQSRYGSAQNALNFWNQHGWY